MTRTLEQCTKRQLLSVGNCSMSNYFLLSLRMKEYQIFTHCLPKSAELLSWPSCGSWEPGTCSPEAVPSACPQGSGWNKAPSKGTTRKPDRHPDRKCVWQFRSCQHFVKVELSLKYNSISENLWLAKNIALEFFQHLVVIGIKLQCALVI